MIIWIVLCNEVGPLAGSFGHHLARLRYEARL